MKILGIIPARSGSKGLPGKNTRLLGGKPLIEWAYDCAEKSAVLDRTILSTDDPAIAGMSAGFGLQAPFIRPAELATDNTPMIDVVIQALDQLAQNGYQPDAVCLLQPTSPLRRPEHIREAVGLLNDNDSVCSVTVVPKEWSPHYLMRITGEGFLDYFMADGNRYTRRQDVPNAYRRDGTVYLTRTSVIRTARNFYGSHCVPMVIDAQHSLSIDHASDFVEAERRIRL